MIYVVSFLIALIVAFAAYKLRMLSLSGMIAATVTGSIIFRFGGISASVLLMVFFLSGSLLGRLNRSKGEARNWKQVLANGLVPTLTVIIITLRHDLREEITLFFSAHLQRPLPIHGQQRSVRGSEKNSIISSHSIPLIGDHRVQYR